MLRNSFQILFIINLFTPFILATESKTTNVHSVIHMKKVWRRFDFKTNNLNLTNTEDPQFDLNDYKLPWNVVSFSSILYLIKIGFIILTVWRHKGKIDFSPYRDILDIKYTKKDESSSDNSCLVVPRCVCKCHLYCFCSLFVLIKFIFSLILEIIFLSQRLYTKLVVRILTLIKNRIL